MFRMLLEYSEKRSKNREIQNICNRRYFVSLFEYLYILHPVI